MGSHSKGCWTYLISSVLLIIAEGFTFYVYSILFLMEGQPQWHSNPSLKTLA